MNIKRVLVVDDNHDSAACFHMLLMKSNLDVQSVHDGLAAVEMAETFAPDVILLDIGLPKMDGYEVCRRIRALPDSDRMVIIGITGWDEWEDHQSSIDAGFNHRMVKPVDLTKLKELLDLST